MRLFARVPWICAVPLRANPKELLWQSVSFPDFLRPKPQMFIGMFFPLIMCNDTETAPINLFE